MALRRRTRQRAGIRTPKGRYVLQNLAQQNKEILGVLTEGPKRPELQRGAVGDEDRRCGQGGDRGEGGVVVLLASGSRGSTRDVAARVHTGLGRPER